MGKQLEINPESLSERAMELVFAKAEEWQTTPEEAMSRLLDQLAEKQEQQSAA